MQCNNLPTQTLSCMLRENWLMSLGQSSQRKSLMEERKLIQLCPMQQRCSILAIFIYEFSSYQSYLYPTTLAYSKKPIQIQYISGSHYPSALLKKKSVQGTCKSEWRPLLAQISHICEIFFFFFFIWNTQNLYLNRAVSGLLDFQDPPPPPSLVVGF